MFSKIVALCAFVAVAQAGLLAAPAHYSPAEAVSSQSIVRHDQAQLHGAPVAKLAYQAAPALAYQAAPAAVTYHSAPAPVTYHSAPAQVAYHSAPAQVAYHSAPAQVAYHSAPAQVAYHSAPAQVAYHSAPAQVAYHSAPVTKVIAQPEEIAYPKYEYNYSVADGHSGDNKSQQESRDGDVVKGSYSFHEADGSIRTVEYTADDHNGFNAVVHNSAPTPAPVVVKAAPVLLKAAAPAHYYHH